MTRPVNGSGGRPLSGLDDVDCVAPEERLELGRRQRPREPETLDQLQRFREQHPRAADMETNSGVPRVSGGGTGISFITKCVLHPAVWTRGKGYAASLRSGWFQAARAAAGLR